jgi:O-antigen ligase
MWKTDAGFNLMLRLTLLFSICACLGVLCALSIGQYGVSVTLIPGVALFVFVLPALMNQTLNRFRTLGKQLTSLHALWLIVFLSSCVFRARDTQAATESTIDLWALYRIGLMAITALILGIRLALRSSLRPISVFSGLFGRLALYASVCLCSTLWSAYPPWTLYKSVEYFVVVVLVATIVANVDSAGNFKAMFDWNWTVSGLLLISIWIGALVWPREAFLPSGGGLLSVQLQGVVPIVADNSVGQSSAILSVIALSRLLRTPQTRGSRLFYTVLFIVTMGTMILSQTRSAILGFFLGVALLLYFSRRIGLVACLATTVALLYLATGAGAFFQEYMRRGQDADAIGSLSGRTEWWEAGWTTFLQRPLTGMGAYTARFTVLAKLGDQGVSTVHNTYLEAVLGVGVIGLVPIMAAFLGVWRSLLRELSATSSDPNRRQLALEAIAVLGVITVRSFFSVGLIAYYDIDFLAILGFAEILRRLPEKHSVPVRSPSAPAEEHRPWCPQAEAHPAV